MQVIILKILDMMKLKGWLASSLVIIVLSAGFVYNKHMEQVNLHAQLANPNYHHYSKVELKTSRDGDTKIRVYWDVLPKILNFEFEEQWHIYYNQQGWIPLKEWDYLKNDVPPYITNNKPEFKQGVEFWGSWVDLPKPLPAGIYSIRVSYEYQGFNWFFNHWTAEQHIVFEVE